MAWRAGQGPTPSMKPLSLFTEHLQQVRLGTPALPCSDLALVGEEGRSPRASIKNDHKVGALKQQKCVSGRSGGQKSDIQVPAGPHACIRARGRLWAGLPASSCFHGSRRPGLVAASLPCPHQASSPGAPSQSPSALSHEGPAMGLGATQVQDEPILTSLT